MSNSTMTMRIAMMRMGIPTVTVTASMFFLPPSPGSSIQESTAFRQSNRDFDIIAREVSGYRTRFEARPLEGVGLIHEYLRASA
jgi:hypothetical protein